MLKDWEGREMKGGKDEEKIKGPLFPRLHVNDTEKGGPRAPPRNKMALYEQLSIPSQRFNSGLASTLPLPAINAGNLFPSDSSSQGGGQERSVFSPFYIPPSTPVHSAEKIHSSSDGVNLNATMAGFERKSTKDVNHQTMNAPRHLFSISECNSFPHDFSSLKNPCKMKPGDDDDDVRVPTFVHPEVASCSNKELPITDTERLTAFSPTNMGHSAVTLGNSPLKTAATISNLSMQTQNVCDKHPKQTTSGDLRSRQQVRNQSEENPKRSVTSWDCSEKNASNLLTRQKIDEPLKHANGSANQERRSSSGDDFGRVYDTNGQFYQEYRATLLQENTACGDDVLVEPMVVEVGNISRARSESCSRPSPRNSHRSPDRAENGTEYRENNVHGSLQVGDVDRNDDVSETSMVDSISGLDISPDDVVGVIGQKHFWKARRAIVNQQRAFAVQVFELHRLIKVQKLIAGSPHLLLEDNRYSGKPSLKVSSAKKLPSEYVLKSPPEIVKLKDDSQKPNHGPECASENAAWKPALPSLNNGIDEGFVSQHSSCGPYSGNPQPAHLATDNKGGPWCFHPPPGNQWLVPIMSPSEGLVYKPYTGPCPPSAGFMAPANGGCGPLSLPPVAGDFMNPIFGVPAAHQEGIFPVAAVGHSYFPPYGFPVMGPVISASAVEQAIPLAGAWPQGQAEQLASGEANFNMHHQSSCNNLNQKNEAVSCKFQTSKDSELQGSTAISPCERALGAGAGLIPEGRDALPLFPMAPAVQVLDQPSQTHDSDQHRRVIKVVPHNPRSATVSAARIFRSIQKERQQYDSV